MAELNVVIHQPVRLKIMSALVALGAGDQVEFTYLRKVLKLTDGNLGAHLAKLEEARYIKIEKTFVERKPRTYVKVTGKGRDAFADHVDALKQIIKGA
jgi:DNA-binding MarR family transcriptional regulator